MPCRFNKRRIWAHRIILEAALQKDNCFLTLTYDEKHAPKNGSLNPKHLQDFLKRFRKSVSPLKVRYFGVGEYGDTTERPHYHLALFGYPTCRRGSTLIRPDRECCSVCTFVKRSWTFGNVYLGRLERESAGYIAGYVTKKLTRADDERLRGRHPEFARMSNRPGIGADMMDEVASTMLAVENLDDIEDVPSALRHGSKLMPLGRYLRRRLRSRIGRSVDTPQSVMEKMEAELLPLREEARKAPSQRQILFKELVAFEGSQARLNMQARQNIYRQKRGL